MACWLIQPRTGGHGRRYRDEPGHAVVTGQQDGQHGGAHPAGVPGGQVDLADQQHEYQTHGDDGVHRALGEQVGEVARGREDRPQSR